MYLIPAGTCVLVQREGHETSRGWFLHTTRKDLALSTLDKTDSEFSWFRDSGWNLRVPACRVQNSAP